MNINIKVIPHSEQRYETVGDWWFTAVGNKPDFNLDWTLEIRVSAMQNPKYEFLVAQHEQTEAMLCFMRGISEESVSEFDKKFEANRTPDDMSEPGDNPSAPYRKEHFFATSIERLIAAELGVDWKEYDDTVMAL